MAANRNIIDSHEQNVWRFIVDQLNQYSYRAEVANILRILKEINQYGGFKSDLTSDDPFDRKAAYQQNINRLRTLVWELYKTEGAKRNVVKDSLFYSSLFSFLLLLTKYAPTKINAEVKELKPESRLFYPDGNQYHHEHNPKNYWDSNSFHKERTMNYIAARRQAIASADPNFKANEIPTPTRDSGSHSRIDTLDPLTDVAVPGFVGFGAGAITTMILGLTPVIAAAPWLIPVILLGGAAAGVGISLAAHFGSPCAMSIKNQFKRFINFISNDRAIKPEQADNLFSYIKSQGNEPASELTVNVNAGPALEPPPYSPSKKPAPVAIPQAKLTCGSSKERLLPEKTESRLSRFCGCLFSGSKKRSVKTSAATVPTMCLSPSSR